jgi:Cys-tRNA(Pro)/Cys-tRNA(Cys) deacylase
VTASGTRATELLRKRGIDHRIHEYAPPERQGRARESRPPYGIEAAAALGVSPDRVWKTLVASVDDRLVLAVVPVAGELDLKRLADACAGRRAELAEPAAAERATGYVVGGISPLAPRRTLPVVIDTSATVQETIFVSAGRRGLQAEVAPDDLVALTGAIVAPIARDH